jgi:hypothetical protein
MKLFEFKMSYLEPDYHKAGDAPFKFPPEGVGSKVEANLIEIEGRNGSGKTTLLNVLALALGYLDREKELETKPSLRRKLQDLDENQTLEYDFRIICDKPEPMELKVERKKGQKQRCWLNSKPSGPETLASELDVVFLTEDDPKKVVNASLGKLARYFRDLDNRLHAVLELITKQVIEIGEFRNFKKNEKSLLDEIEVHEKRTEQSKSTLAELERKLSDMELRNGIKEKLELLEEEEEITSDYEHFRKKYERLKDKKESDVLHNLYKERARLSEVDSELKEISGRILQTCSSLQQYGVMVHGDRLLDDDYAELNNLMKRVKLEKQGETAKIALVDEMIDLLQRHSEEEVVPLVDKTVSEALNELYKMKARLSFDRVLALLNALERTIQERKDTITRHSRIEDKILTLSQKCEDLKSVEEIEKKFTEAEKRYLRLQNALQQDKSKMLSKWRELRSIEGDPEDIRRQMHELEIQIQTEESLKGKCTESLRILRENASGKPKNEDKEKGLQNLRATITRMRENLFQWTQILAQPTEAREQFASMTDRPGFGLTDYEKFAKAVGEFLGSQFEPVSFADKLHEIKFFNIEKDTFITKEDRQIPIDKLSQGQSKITTLTGSFKEMEEGRKKIVLIDEIADLDPENLQKVKNMLREKFSEGSLMLAVLVRPTHDPSSKNIDVRGWA